MTSYKPSERLQRQLDLAFDRSNTAGSTDQQLRWESIRGMAGDYARQLAMQCPESRELSLALTKLDEVVFWAREAIARNE